MAGIFVHARPEAVQRVAEVIAEWHGAEVHATSPDGKLVVTLEASSSRDVAKRIEEIQRLDAVLSASLVYQHNEPLAAMMQQVNEGCP